MRNLHIAGLLALAFLMAACSTAAGTKQAGHTVKLVIDAGGHGSGVHIGNGFIVTAAHVASDQTKMTVKADDGSSREATVLWTNKKYDVAMLRMDPAEKIGVARLSCRDPRPNENLHARGNPGNIEFITTNGRVAGSAREVGPWSSVFVFDATVAPGMSGGPVLDNEERVVGITVGLMLVPLGFSPALVPISYIVPASTVCMLMGRA